MRSMKKFGVFYASCVFCPFAYLCTQTEQETSNENRCFNLFGDPVTPKDFDYNTK